MYKLKVDNQVYLSTSDDTFDKLIHLNDGSKLLQGFYYGSSSCIDSTGSGWFLYIDNFGNIVSRRTIKLSLYKDDILMEEYDLKYNDEKFINETQLYPLEGTKHIKGIHMRSLHRFGTNERMPVEISSVQFTD